MMQLAAVVRINRAAFCGMVADRQNVVETTRRGFVHRFGALARDMDANLLQMYIRSSTAWLAHGNMDVVTLEHAAGYIGRVRLAFAQAPEVGFFIVESSKKGELGGGARRRSSWGFQKHDKSYPHRSNVYRYAAPVECIKHPVRPPSC